MGSSGLILVGEAPGGEIDLTDREWMSLTGGAAQNLCRIAGWDWETFLRDTMRMNLFYAPQSRWNADQAKRNASLLMPAIQWGKVLLLGNKVATAFEVEGKPFYEWFWSHDALMARVPHPSGRNRKWNTEVERERAREFLGGLL